MSEFCNSILFTLLLAQSTAFVFDKYIESSANKQGLSTPLIYETLFYDLHVIVTALIMIITTIICSVRFSWWLIIIFPLINLFASSILAALANISILHIMRLRWDLTRFISVIVTALSNIILVYMWFK